MEKNSTVEAHMKGPIHEYHDLVDSFSSSSSTSEISSGSLSLESDSFEEVTSSSSSGDDQLVVVADPLSDMSSLFQQLPIKRGLSRFYQGKSQSFTSLKNVRSLEDLAKAENPYNKRLKSYKSYVGVCNIPSSMSKGVSKMQSTGSSSRGSCSSLNARRDSATNLRPPIPPHRSTSTNTIPNQTVLFA
ncbi:uncharacterized serine-rich protein C215.13 [Cajanus cajan]|uniref:Oxidative stress 3 n=1 Tax=Cajanus cajan TaxID=3821 RepID=A0A151U9T8_CAJCA|nr:uncharacterized serine-rich protein C215.13 [Cajanus cajan]KYP76029.1 hypothetical protein KK1_020247 [Cajanus cajan]